MAAGSTPRSIFICYRRQDSLYDARRLSDYLAGRFGEDQLLSAVDTIEPGVDFAEALVRTAAACQVLPVVIGPSWLVAADERGRRRLDDPGDFVRLEIEAALAHGVRVIPILVEGAVMPAEDDLPESIAGLAHLNTLIIRHESFFTDAGRLAALIESVLRDGPKVVRVAAGDPSTPPRRAPRRRRARAHEPQEKQQTGKIAIGGRSVFISYRRQLSESLALLVRMVLTKHDFDTFVDLENLDSGEFERIILSQIEAREHFLVLLEPGSLDQIGEDGDWLRREIAHALTHHRNVVPLTANGFEFRRDLVLPSDVARLPSFNAVAIQPGYFDAAMERLRTRFLKMPSNPTTRP